MVLYGDSNAKMALSAIEYYLGMYSTFVLKEMGLPFLAFSIVTKMIVLFIDHLRINIYVYLFMLMKG